MQRTQNDEDIHGKKMKIGLVIKIDEEERIYHKKPNHDHKFKGLFLIGKQIIIGKLFPLFVFGFRFDHFIEKRNQSQNR
jgi:hypothetical protein